MERANRDIRRRIVHEPDGRACLSVGGIVAGSARDQCLPKSLFHTSTSKCMNAWKMGWFTLSGVVPQPSMHTYGSSWHVLRKRLPIPTETVEEHRGDAIT